MRLSDLNLTEPSYKLIRCYYIYAGWNIHKLEDYEKLIHPEYVLILNDKYYVIVEYPAHGEGSFLEYTKERFFSMYTFSERKAKNKAKQEAERCHKPYRKKAEWVLKSKDFNMTAKAIKDIYGWYKNKSHNPKESVIGKKYKCDIEYYKDVMAKKHDRWKRVYIIKDDAHYYEDKIYEEQFNESSFKKHFEIVKD